MNIIPIAYFHSPLTSKFGIPRQGGLASSLEGRIVLEPAYRHEEAVRGLEAFSHLWLIWEFSANSHESSGLTVRPPRLGGNERVGVFASRSPFRPNRLGLTSVEISRVDHDCANAPVIWVKGADLMDGTPIYDIKPYVAYADCHPEARSGFVDERQWQELTVEFPSHLQSSFSSESLKSLIRVLALDPRPQYQNDPNKTYGMPYENFDIRFRVADGVLTVTDIIQTCEL
jgi:tRNA-Thr(GGU) m(6)t(6)A37 methyltransferase TsaA